MIENLLSTLDQHLPGWSPKVIADIGAHDGTQTVELATRWPDATILALECNPDVWPTCLERVQPHKNVIMLPLAACDIAGPIKFFKPKTKNTGYGSIYVPTGTYPVEPMPVDEIPVSAIRLDTLLSGLHLPGIDMFWLDAQGGELSILLSLGQLITHTKVIYTEYMEKPMYSGQPLVSDMVKFLSMLGFTAVWIRPELDGWSGDAIFIRQ